jgi:cytoskeletal protein CcmA (bactofilin family)
VVAADRVELQASAVLTGDLHTRIVIVHEGARVNGTVRMTGGEAEVHERPAVQVMR